MGPLGPEIGHSTGPLYYFKTSCYKANVQWTQVSFPVFTGNILDLRLYIIGPKGPITGSIIGPKYWTLKL